MRSLIMSIFGFAPKYVNAYRRTDGKLHISSVPYDSKEAAEKGMGGSSEYLGVRKIFIFK